MPERLLHKAAILILIIYLIPFGVKLIPHHCCHGQMHQMKTMHYDVKCNICDHNSIIFGEISNTVHELNIEIGTFYAYHYSKIFISDFNSQFYLLRAPPFDKC